MAAPTPPAADPLADPRGNDRELATLVTAGTFRRTQEGRGGKGCQGLGQGTAQIGKVRAAAIMDSLGIAASRRVRGLGIHQRRALVDFMNEK